MSERQIFKVVILSHDADLFEELYDIFGIEFEKSFTQTSGSAFAYSHFDVDGQRLTAQFWLLESSPQWHSIRNLYMKGTSGIIMLCDPSLKNAENLNKRLLREFVSINRYPVPIIVLNPTDHKIKKTQEFAEDIARWAGYVVPHLTIKSGEEKIKSELETFMSKVKDWRAKNVIFQTLKIYFGLDSINNLQRKISVILRQLRQIYTSSYYELIEDETIISLIKQAAFFEGYHTDDKDEYIIYEKDLKSHPWEDYEKAAGEYDLSKPKIERISK